VEYSILDADTFFGAWPIRRADLSLNRLMETLRQHKVRRALTLSTTGIFYDYRRGNEETVAACKQASDLLFPTATLDPRAGVGFEDEIAKRLQQNIRIFRFFPQYQQWPLDFLPFRQILQELAGQKAVVMVATPRLGDISTLLRLVEDEELTLLLTEVSAPQMGELMRAMKAYPNLYVETRLLAEPTLLATLCEQVGPERLVFGSQAPLHYFSSALLPLLSAPLTEEVRQQILGGNLLRLLRRENSS
jgi:hypothetical protein